MTARYVATVSSEPATTDHLIVSDTYVSFQGDGPAAGRPALFIRLGGCGLRCHWCDAAYTWDATQYDLYREMSRRHVGDIAAQAVESGTSLAVLTGGEPLLQQDHPAFRALCGYLRSARMDVHIETAGVIKPSSSTLRAADLIIVSPKLSNSGMALSQRIRPQALQALAAAKHTVYTFVCQGVSDVDEAAAVVVAHELPRDRVWIMPEGTTADGITARLRDIADRTLAHRFNLTGRLHVQLWDGERGR